MTSIIFNQKPKYRIRIQNGAIICEYTQNYKYPNIFRRFFYWLLLDWKFERISE